MTIHELIRQRILILDGAMGTMIQRYHLTEDDFRGQRFKDITSMLKGNYDVLNITHSDIVEEIHDKYLAASADLISTNTFNSQAVSQAGYQLENFAHEMALEGARSARRAADRYSTPTHPRFVCGSVGPTNKICSISPNVNNPVLRKHLYDELFKAYTEQMDALIAGGTDTFLIETIIDTLNAKAAIVAAMQSMERAGKTLPIMLSVTINNLTGNMPSGQTLEAFLADISPYPIFSIGLNCSFGAKQMKPYLKELAHKAPYYISVYPNAGIPNSMGFYNETAETTGADIQEFIDEGIVNIVGGCCGTDETFIAEYARRAKGKRPPLMPLRNDYSANAPTAMPLSIDNAMKRG